MQIWAGDERDPNICFSLMLLLHSCSLVATCQSSRVARRHVLHSFLRDGWQRGRHLPSTLAQQGFASHSLIVNWKVGREGHSHMLTHWQLHSAHWDIISQTVEGWCSLCGFSLETHTYIMLISRDQSCLLASYFSNGHSAVVFKHFCFRFFFFRINTLLDRIFPRKK